MDGSQLIRLHFSLPKRAHLLTLILVAFLLAPLAVSLLPAVSGGVVTAQEATPESGESESAEEPPNTEPEATEEISEPVTEATESTEPEIEATEIPATEIPATESPTEDPTVAPTVTLPVIAYTPADAPQCEPADLDSPETIASGGQLDYLCQFRVGLALTDLDFSDLVIGWQIIGQADGGWQMQLKAPSTSDDPDPQWTDPADLPVQFQLSSPEFETDGDQALIHFQVRLSRPACAMSLPVISLTANAVVSVPDLEDVVVNRIESQSSESQYLLQPQLTAIETVPPVVSLDEFSVEPIEFSLSDQIVPAQLTLVVDNPVLQCTDWVVSVSIDGSQEGDSESASSASFVAVPAGTGAGTSQFVVNLEISIPGGTAAGQHDTEALISIESGLST